MTLDLETTLLFCSAVQVAVAATLILVGGSSRMTPWLVLWKVSFVFSAIAFLLRASPFLPLSAASFADLLLLVVTPLQVDGVLRFNGVEAWRGWRLTNVVAAALILVFSLIVMRAGIDTAFWVAIRSAEFALEAAIGVGVLLTGARPWRVPALRIICGCFIVSVVVNAGKTLLSAALVGGAAAPDSSFFALSAMIGTLVLMVKAFGVVAVSAERTEGELRLLSRDLEHQASTDPLTKVRNRRSFYDQGAAMVALAQRHDRLLTALMVDIDRFKGINDTHGHATGDQVLIAVADTLTRMLRTSDMIGRVGGEEFAILLVETGQRAAELTAERLRRGITALHSLSPTFDGLTISLGLAPLTTDVTGLDALLQSADQALYRAKREGRNRWVAAA